MDNKRIAYFDLLNITAAFCVIAMHCNGIVHTFSNTIAWKESLMVEVLAYWAVPVFFMLSGATLLGYEKKYDTKTFFLRRIKKTVFPFLIWSVIACFDQVRRGVYSFSDFSVSDFISRILLCRFESVYWFFIPLFAVYLAIPVLSCIIQSNEKYLQYMLGCGFVTVSVFPFLCNAFHIEYNASFTLPVAGGNVFLVLLGYWLSRKEMSKKVRYVVYIMGLVGATSRYVSTLYMSSEEGINKVFWGYQNWPCVFLSVAVFVAFKSIQWEKILKIPLVETMVIKLANVSFGVYLVHMFVLRILQSISGANVYGVKWRVLGPGIIYILSVCIVRILKSVPIVKEIVP